MKTLTITASLLAFGIPVALATLPAATKPKPAPAAPAPAAPAPLPVVLAPRRIEGTVLSDITGQKPKPKDNLIRRPPASWRK